MATNTDPVLPHAHQCNDRRGPRHLARRHLPLLQQHLPTTLGDDPGASSARRRGRRSKLVAARFGASRNLHRLLTARHDSAGTVRGVA